jgi:Zn-dependent peptidase ImmA (M78 family)
LDFRNIDDPNLDAEEIFCNRVAAEVLVPQKNFLETINSSEFILSVESVSKVARGYGVSDEVIMRRLLDFNRISKSDYEKFRTATREKWENKKEEKSKAIVPYPRRVLGANGYLFTHLTLLAYQREKINLLNVGQFLRASLTHLPKIESELYGYAK